MPYMTRLTMDIIGTVAFGVDLESIEYPEKEWTDKVRNTPNHLKRYRVEK
jgi:hypothetical protein